MSKLAVFIHGVMLSRVEERLEQFFRYFNESGLYSQVDFIRINILGDKLPTLSQNLIRCKTQFNLLGSDMTQYELYHQANLYEFCKENPDYKILYLHTKMVGKELNLCIEDQIEYNLYFLVKKWKECIDILDKYQACGLDLRTDPVLHYSSHWWANASYIRTLPHPYEFIDLSKYPNPLNSQRHSAEFWLTYPKKVDDYYCMWDNGINVYAKHLNRYDKDLYINNMTYTLSILYLTNDGRHFTFEKSMKFLSECKYKDNIIVFILTNSNDTEFYEGIMKIYLINYKVFNIALDNNYLVKLNTGVEYSKLLNIKYIMKLDNDIFVNTQTLNYMYENLNVLDNNENFILQPTVSNSIPTVEQFIVDFLNDEQKNVMYGLFKEFKFGSYWGVDYSSINNEVEKLETWNGDNFYEAVKKIDHHYKGVHPIRLNHAAQLQLNEYILELYPTIRMSENFSLIYNKSYPYFCSGLYCIQTSLLEKVLNSKDLFVDLFEEVALNKYRDMHKLNMVIIKNSAAIHPVYNSVPNHTEYERYFVSRMVD